MQMEDSFLNWQTDTVCSQRMEAMLTRNIWKHSLEVWQKNGIECLAKNANELFVDQRIIHFVKFYFFVKILMCPYNCEWVFILFKFIALPMDINTYHELVTPKSIDINYMKVIRFRCCMIAMKFLVSL